MEHLALILEQSALISGSVPLFLEELSHVLVVSVVVLFQRLD